MSKMRLIFNGNHDRFSKFVVIRQSEVRPEEFMMRNSIFFYSNEYM